MNAKLLIGSTMAAGLLGLGALVGSVVGTGNALAQTPSATATATAVPNNPGTTQTTPPADVPGDKGLGFGMGMRGGRGHHGEGFGDMWGGATADNATRAISTTSSLIDLVKADLAYANGKMDTADVQRWVDSASALLQKAQSANGSSQYGQTVAYAGAARELAMIAYANMANELTASALPSNGQIRGGMHMDAQANATAPTQAQASYVLANTYNRLVAQGAVIGSSSEAASYLTEAQSAYGDAYNAYQAGNYESAVTFARLAERLAGVANRVADAGTAPANSTTPVTVPAPSF
jgi:hypothetical protein